MANPQGSGVHAASRLRAWVASVCGSVTALVGLTALLVLCFWPSVRVGWSLPEMNVAGVALAYVLPGLAVVVGIVAAIVRRPLVGGLWVVLSFVVPVFFWTEWTFDETRIAYFLLTSLAAWSTVALGAMCGRSSSRPIQIGVVVLSVLYAVALAYELWGQLMVWGALLTLSYALVHAFGGVLLGAAALAAGRWLDGWFPSTRESRLPAWARVVAGLVPVLALCAMAWRAMGMPLAAPPDPFIPTPRTATLVYTTERWSVWLHQELVKRTRQCLRPRLVQRYYLQGAPEDVATLVFTNKNSEPHRVLGVTDDGTLVLQWRCYDFVVVRRDGAELFRRPVDMGDDVAWVSVAYDDGVLLQEYAMSPTDVFFVPWSPPVLEMENRVRVTTKDVDWHRCPYWRSGDTLVWSTRQAVETFNLRTQERRSFNPQGDGRMDYDVKAFSGDTVVVNHDAYDVATGEKLTANLPGEAFALRGSVAYFVDALCPKWQRGRRSESLRYSLVAQRMGPQGGEYRRLLTLRETTVTVHGLDPHHLRFPNAVRKEGLIIWDGEQWQRVPWLERLNDE